MCSPNSQLVHDGWGNVARNLDIQHNSRDTLRADVPGPFTAARASSPMKKSRSSVPLFMERCPPCPAPPVRYDGLFATAGLPDPDPPPPPAGPFVAIAVGKTKEGESLPAKPAITFRQQAPRA